MQNPELMIELLEEMSKEPDGSMLVVRRLSMSDSELQRAHHVELLCDASLAQQKSDSIFRITNAGYKFLGAISQDRPITFSKFKKFLQEGIELAEAVRKVINFVTGFSRPAMPTAGTA